MSRTVRGTTSRPIVGQLCLRPSRQQAGFGVAPKIIFLVLEEQGSIPMDVVSWSLTCGQVAMNSGQVTEGF